MHRNRNLERFPEGNCYRKRNPHRKPAQTSYCTFSWNSPCVQEPRAITGGHSLSSGRLETGFMLISLHSLCHSHTQFSSQISGCSFGGTVCSCHSLQRQWIIYHRLGIVCGTSIRIHSANPFQPISCSCICIFCVDLVIIMHYHTWDCIKRTSF